MITKQDPTQPLLFSRYQNLLSDPALRVLEEGWQGVFHRMILRQSENGDRQKQRKFFLTAEKEVLKFHVLHIQFPRDAEYNTLCG